MASRMARVNCLLVASPPMSRVRTLLQKGVSIVERQDVT